MNISRLKKKYSGMDLYRQAAAVKHLYISFPWKRWYKLTVFGKSIKPNFSGAPLFLGNGVFHVYIDRPATFAIPDFYYQRQMWDKKFITQLKKFWEKKIQGALVRGYRDIKKDDLKGLGKKELLQKFHEFSRLYDSYWSESIFLDSYDIASDTILEKAVAQENKNISPKDLEILMAPEHFSCLQREKISMMKLCYWVKKNKKFYRFVIRGNGLRRIKEVFPEFFEKLRQHAKSFYWMYTDYAHSKRLDEKFFLKQITVLLRNKKLYDREKDSLLHFLAIQKRKKQLIGKLRLSSEFLHTLHFLTVLAEWRDERKFYSQMANNVLFFFAKDFSRRLKIPLFEIESLFWWELKQLPKLKKAQRKYFKKRYKAGFYTDTPLKNASCIVGSRAVELHKYVESLLQGKPLQGRTAYPGVVRGKAKIIFSQKDFYKMKRGDILVAPNTRPEYVPVMKISGAIITEEGGLTCHAAIVSRELKVPCIVGMQGVLNALHDGEKIEVDAGKGVIKNL